MNKIFNKFLIGFLFLFVFSVFYTIHSVSAYTSSFSYTASIQTSSGGGSTMCNIKGMIGIDKTVYTPGETIVASARVDSFDCITPIYPWSAFAIKGKNNGVVQTILSNSSYQPRIFGTTFTKNFTAPVTTSFGYHMDFDIDGFVDGNGGVMATPGIGYSVVSVPIAPTVTVKANGSNSLTVNYGSSVNISWISQNANSCSCNEGSCGTSTGNGSERYASGNPYTMTATRTFTVTCSN